MGQMNLTVAKFTRLRNTTDGNARWAVHTDKGVFRSKPDSMVGFDVEALEAKMYRFAKGMPVVANINGKGQIDEIREDR